MVLTEHVIYIIWLYNSQLRQLNICLLLTSFSMLKTVIIASIGVFHSITVGLVISCSITLPPLMVWYLISIPCIYVLYGYIILLYHRSVSCSSLSLILFIILDQCMQYMMSPYVTSYTSSSFSSWHYLQHVYIPPLKPSRRSQQILVVLDHLYCSRNTAVILSWLLC